MEKNAGSGMGLLLVIVAIIVIFLLFPPLSGGLVYALILNSIIGFIATFLVNAIFGLGIKYSLLVIIFVALLGLLAVAILIILNLMGIRK